MQEIVTVKTAQYAVSNTKQIIKTGSVGSCLVITLFDPIHIVGGLAHAMLPTSGKTHQVDDESNAPAKYIDQAVDRLVIELEKIGGDLKQFQAKIIGGATMFRHLIAEEHSVGTENIKFARDYLQKKGIHTILEDTGGSSGRSIEFNTANGVVDVSVKL